MRAWKSSALLLFAIVVVTLAGNGGVLADGFSFAIIADPHIDGDPGREAHFRTAVAAIIGTKNIRNTELVFVVGDIGWGGSGATRHLNTAKTILDDLNAAGIPYVPIIGDNEVQTGCEAEFNTVFSPQYTYLSTATGVGNWQKAPVPTNGMYLQNFSFDYKQCHFTCADVASRTPGDEGGELHDFEGGTWGWFKSDIENAPKPKGENINIFTHIGMFHTGIASADQYLFSSGELDTIKDFINPYKDNVDSNYAGHIHQNFTWDVPLLFPYYTVRVTDETWYDTRWPESDDQEITVRWVDVDSSGSAITYTQHIEDVPEPATVALLLGVIGCLVAPAVWRKMKRRA